MVAEVVFYPLYAHVCVCVCMRTCVCVYAHVCVRSRPAQGGLLTAPPPQPLLIRMHGSDDGNDGSQRVTGLTLHPQVHAVFSEGSPLANPVNPINSPTRFLTGLFKN